MTCNGNLPKLGPNVYTKFGDCAARRKCPHHECPPHSSLGIESVPKILRRWLSRSDHPTTPNKSNRKESSLPETPLGGGSKGSDSPVQLEFVIFSIPAHHIGTPIRCCEIYLNVR